MAPSYPSVEDYLQQLPAGIESYPAALVKGSALRVLRRHPGFDEVLRSGGIPEQALRLLRDAPTDTTWMPEVHFNTAMVALYDTAFRKNGGYAAFEDWIATRNRELFETALYRMLFVFVSPERVTKLAPSQWSAFRRGSTLKVRVIAPQHTQVELASPPNLEPPAVLHACSGAFRASIRAAGGHPTKVEWKLESPGVVHWQVRWT